MTERKGVASTLTKNTFSRTKSAIISGSLLAVLIWGSSLLILAISHLQSTKLQLKKAQYLDNLSKYHYDDLNLTGNRIGFEQTRNKSFSPVFRPIQWVSDPQSITSDKGLYTTNDNDTYLIKSILNPEFSQLLYNGSDISHEGLNYTIDRFVSSPDLKYALIMTNRTSHWRHSSFGLYWLLDIETQNLRKVHGGKLSLAQWSPTSDNLALVYENNVYVYDLESSSVTQVSYDGGADVFNGKPDWVYEEEVYEGDSALWWSPNGEYLAYLKLNDTLVPEFPIPYFVQDTDGFKNSPYPELRKIKYPKPGYPNPDVALALFNVKKNENEVVKYSDDIFTEVIWVGNDKLLLKSINREADFLKVVLIDALDYKYEIIRDEVTDSWFEITHDTFFVPKSESILEDGYIDTISVDGYNHLAYYSPPSNSTPRILTHGEFEVVAAPSAFDYSNNLVYYSSTKDSSIERHIYALELLSGEEKRITHGEGWYSATFSAGARFALISYRGPNVPTQSLVDLSNEKDQALESNHALKKLLADYDLPEKTFGEVEIFENVTVNFVEIKPPHFDPSKEYPILFFVYGGPGSQLVTKEFKLSFPEVVASQLDAIVVTIDGRGTGFKGREFRSLVRDNLGHYEVIDQIAAAKNWGKKSYVDASKVAIFGWSYGGFMTLKTLEADAGETFKYGMSVAPVTDWRFYDSIYTERYMHSPGNNNGYYPSSVHNVTQIAKATRFLLMHGTGDDNVHIQNSFQFLDQLNLAGVENYDLHVFPDSDHSISYHNAGVIVYDKLLKWLGKAFRGDYIDY